MKKILSGNFIQYLRLDTKMFLTILKLYTYKKKCKIYIYLRKKP